MANTHMPGTTPVRESYDPVLIWAGPRHGEVALMRPVTLSSAAIDPANSPVTTIRGGMVLALDTSGEAVPYVEDATDCTAIPVGILVDTVNTYDEYGTARDRQVNMLVAGGVRADQCIRLDAYARTVLHAMGICFDDASPRGCKRTVTTNTTVTASKTGSCYIARAANIEFTLPALANGLSYEFLMVTDHTLKVSSAAGNDMIADGDAAASLVTFSTSSAKIGSHVKVECCYIAGSLRWIVTPLTQNTMTVA